MSSPDDLPEEPSGRVVSVRLTRELLLLLAALGFLAFAILLAVIFPPGTPQSGGNATAIGMLPSEAAGTQSPDDRLPTPGSAAGETPSDGSYPGPDAGTELLPTLSPAELEATAATSLSPADVEATAVASANAIDNGYPAPDTAGATPGTASQTPESPIFGPTVVNPGGSANNVTSPIPTFAPPDGTSQPTPTDVVEATETLAPTQEPVPTEGSQPPSSSPKPRPTPSTEVEAAGGESPPTQTVAPAAPPVDELSGNIRWTAAQSPIIMRRDTRLMPGASLVIDPGVEVRMAPGVAFYVEGTLLAAGAQGNPVRFVGIDGRRWDGIYGRGGNLTFEYTEFRNGGNGGTTLATDGGALTIRNGLITDSGGQVRVKDSTLEVRNTEISGNDMPFGAALETTFNSGGFVTLTGNRIGGNNMAPGVPNLLISNPSLAHLLHIDMQGNLLVGDTGPNLTLQASGAMSGAISCNALVYGGQGLSLKSSATTQPSGWGLVLRNNAIEDHTPAIVPIYATPQEGIGRGATSDLPLDMRANWWRDETGPYDPLKYQDGRGEAVGVNIEYTDWLGSRPACAPQP